MMPKVIPGLTLTETVSLNYAMEEEMAFNTRRLFIATDQPLYYLCVIVWTK